VFVGAEIHCQHGDRKPSETTGILEVVAGDKEGLAAADVITLKATVERACERHPEWIISTPSGRENKKAPETKLEVEAWSALTSPKARFLTWLGAETPKEYIVRTEACTGRSGRYAIRVYPKDRIELKVTAFSLPLGKITEDGLELFFANVKLKVLAGTFAFEAQWAEAENDWRAYYKWNLAAGFDPLFEIAVRVPFAGPVPSFLTRWIAEIGLFGELQGEIVATANGSREGPDSHQRELEGKVEGKVNARLGVQLKVGKIVDVECYGETSFSVEGVLPREEGKWGPHFEITRKWGGLLAVIKLAFWNGKIEKESNVQLIGERELGKKQIPLVSHPEAQR
jgi:hypothetical protein